MLDPMIDWHVNVLARTIYGEARGESPDGREAVAAVIMNRCMAAQLYDTADRWGLTIADVCLRPKQFSCWNADDGNRQVIIRAAPGDKAFMECFLLAFRACHGFYKDETGGADHYHAEGLKPDWADTITFTTQIGRHLFYRELEGQPDATQA